VRRSRPPAPADQNRVSTKGCRKSRSKRASSLPEPSGRDGWWRCYRDKPVSSYPPWVS
jgi:hypothetical protein